MKSMCAWLITVAGATAALGAGAPPADGDVPVAPIPAVEYQGWTNAFRLAGSELEAVIVPDTGRLASLAPSGSTNLLRVDPTLAGKTAVPEATDYWFNFGGDWLWPVAQNRWPDVHGADWPPSRLLDGRPWSGRAWKAADGAACCLLEQEYGAPLHIRVSRLFRLPSDPPRLEVRQKITRTAESTIPVTLWNISQLARAEAVVMPVEATSAFSNGVAVLKFDPPGGRTLARCPGVVVYHARSGGEHKLGSDSPRAWIAARKGDVLLIEQAVAAEPGGEYPDQGCRVEMYSNSGLAYSEIETLSAEKNLLPGETLENTLLMSCHRVDPDLSACDLAAAARRALKEDAAPAGTPAPELDGPEPAATNLPGGDMPAAEVLRP
jgi:hypothetical protein